MDVVRGVLDYIWGMIAHVLFCTVVSLLVLWIALWLDRRREDRFWRAQYRREFGEPASTRKKRDDWFVGDSSEDNGGTPEQTHDGGQMRNEK